MPQPSGDLTVLSAVDAVRSSRCRSNPGSTLEGDALVVLGRRGFKRGKYGALLFQRPDQLLKDQHAAAAPDHEWVKRVRDDSPLQSFPQIQKVVDPVLEHAG